MKHHKTNIVAFEMIAAVTAILILDKLVPESVYIRHFADNRPTKNCIIAGFPKQEDLKAVVGMLWYEAVHRTTPIDASGCSQRLIWRTDRRDTITA